MAFASNSGGGPMADINVTPLVDVMLVLLIIFMVTMPIQSFPIKVDLPQKTDKPLENPKEPPEPIRLRIDASNQVYWNDSPTPVTALQNMMKAEVERDPTNQPTLEIDTNDDAEYEVLAKVLAAAKNADMIKIGFVQKSQ
ncbi:biopolymer transport protein ExbD [Luteimonas cucumeris]|uniref:Biopolymer transport protein ExbD n=1 Tax=Luteimonas cucumeris TaxID=985012 RepID=A0A562KVV5_9GAMM|nr:biopolymer transporter ExbD [Luteimonas cucumeris]TWH99487.1 biopolymer transport protein ExbD [Luteimonas cucumeris]